MRVQPFRYYCDILFASLRDQKQYDQLPNFTVCVSHMCVCPVLHVRIRIHPYLFPLHFSFFLHCLPFAFVFLAP